jgi:hypothetical protein
MEFSLVPGIEPRPPDLCRVVPLNNVESEAVTDNIINSLM